MDSKPDLRIRSCGDIHLLHRKTPTRYIISNLDKYLTNKSVLSQTDLLILPGDVFDRMTTSADIDLQYAMSWIHRTLLICAQVGCRVRVLEGTPLHDRGHSTLFETINRDLKETHGYGADLRHVMELSVEHLPDLDIRLAFVPDEWRSDSAETLSELQALLKAKGWDQVDFAIMHGYFAHQLPMGSKSHICHSLEEYEKLTRYAIFIGHVHTASRVGKAFAAGSFEGLGHGHEEPKGYWSYVLDGSRSGDFRAEFIENKDAKIYKTIKLPEHLDVESCLRWIDEVAERLPAESHLKIKVPSKSHALLGMSQHFAQRWCFIHVEIEADKGSSATQLDLLVPPEIKRSSMVINPNTITSLIEAALIEQGVTSGTIAGCLDKLKEAR